MPALPDYSRRDVAMFGVARALLADGTMSLGYTRFVRAAMIHVELLEQRRRLGQDKRDEVWAGVLHMVPPPTAEHQLVASDLLVILHRIARRHGLRAAGEIGLFNPRVKQDDKDYRVPDLVVASSHTISKRGVEGKATLVVELLSPGDESRAKLPFYAKVGVREVWLLDPATRVIEVLTLRDGRMMSVRAHKGFVTSPALGIELSTIKGKLRILDGTRIDEL